MLGLRIQLLCWTFLIFTIPILHSEDLAVEVAVSTNEFWVNELKFKDFRNGTSVLSRHVRDTNETTTNGTENDERGCKKGKYEAQDIMSCNESGIPFPISMRNEDVCMGCPKNWNETVVESGGWNWIWADHARHNYLRRLHGLPDMRLNLKLCKCAQMWANKHVTGSAGHSGYCLESMIGGGSGVGRWWPDLPALAWYSEITRWNFDKGAHKTPWGWENTGHFAQILGDHRYHCTAQANSATGTSGVAQYDSGDQKYPENLPWIYPPYTLKEVLDGTAGKERVDYAAKYVSLT